MNEPFNKRNVIDWILIFVYIIMHLVSDDLLYRNFSLLGIALLGIAISIGILIFKKSMTKPEKTREYISIVLLVAAAVYAIIRIKSV